MYGFSFGFVVGGNPKKVIVSEYRWEKAKKVLAARAEDATEKQEPLSKETRDAAVIAWQADIRAQVLHA